MYYLGRNQAESQRLRGLVVSQFLAGEPVTGERRGDRWGIPQLELPWTVLISTGRYDATDSFEDNDNYPQECENRWAAYSPL